MKKSNCLFPGKTRHYLSFLLRNIGLKSDFLLVKWQNPQHVPSMSGVGKPSTQECYFSELLHSCAVLSADSRSPAGVETTYFLPSDCSLVPREGGVELGGKLHPEAWEPVFSQGGATQELSLVSACRGAVPLRHMPSQEQKGSTPC